MKLNPLLCSLLALPALALPARAADAADPSARLREQLKAALLQLRTAQTETANLRAAKAVADAKITELETKLTDSDKRNAALVKRSNEDRAASEETIAKLNNSLAEREKRIGQYKEALAKWKDGYNKAAAIARTKEEERSTLASEAIVLRRTVADRETKNVALFNTSIEILERFENYALGKALGAREPFISSSRVKVENLVQGYKDRVLANRAGAPAAKP